MKRPRANCLGGEVSWGRTVLRANSLVTHRCTVFVLNSSEGQQTHSLNWPLFSPLKGVCMKSGGMDK